MGIYVKLLFLAFAITVVIGMILMKLICKDKINSEINNNNIRRKKTSIITGIMIMNVIIISLICINMPNVAKEESTRKIIIGILGAGCFGIVGMIDELKKNKLTKMIGMMLIAMIYIIYIISNIHPNTDEIIPFFKNYIEVPYWIYIVINIITMMLIIQLLDQVNQITGLTSIITSIITTCITIIAIMFNTKDVGILGSITAGMCIGFFVFNFSPLKLKLSSTGICFLGGIIGILTLNLKISFAVFIILLIQQMVTRKVFEFDSKENEEVIIANDNKQDKEKILVISSITLILSVITLISVY